MSVLMATPYDLVFRDLVEVTVQAYNVVGWSPISVVNTAGSKIQTVPVKMNTPTRGTNTLETQIHSEWIALADV
jgi:hypothetical protein